MNATEQALHSNVVDNPSAPATQDEFDMSWTTFLRRLF